MDEKTVWTDEERTAELQSRVRELEYDCAELTKHNQDLTERVKKLASRQPTWPKKYRPRKHNNSHG